MKLGEVEARKYMSNMRSSIGCLLITKDSLYFGKSGHLRLARECGVALNDFNESGQKEILSASYGIIYVIGCNLKPILSAKEWINEMKSQIK